MLKNGKLYDGQARTCLKRLIASVSNLHQMNIMHLDICLENLVIADPTANDPFETLTLIDYGAALAFRKNEKVEDELGEDINGTLEFTAPEVLSQHEYSKHCDYWAIGIIAYTLLSGSLPFYCVNKTDLMKQIEEAFFSNDILVEQKVSPEARDFLR